MRTFNNFADLAKALKVRVHKSANSEEVRKCRKCGGNMHLVEGTNIFVCEGKNGKECHNRALKRVNGFNGEGSLSYVPFKKKIKQS